MAGATRARITQIIEELEYRPNTFARGLKTLRSHLVGIVLPDLSNPFYPTLVRGVQDELSASAYYSVIVNTDAGPSKRESSCRSWCTGKSTA